MLHLSGNMKMILFAFI